MMCEIPSMPDKAMRGTRFARWVVALWVLGGILLCGSVGVSLGDIYWFEDDGGVVHLSNVPVDARFRFKEREPLPQRKDDGGERQRERYDTLIEKVASEEKVDPDLLRAVVQVESNYDPNAISPKGAMGLMQLMPTTARRIGVLDPFHPEQNLGGGARHLRELMRKFGDRLPWVLAAYNAGEEAVEKYQGVPPFPETRAYVDKVLQRFEQAKRKHSASGDDGRKGY